MRNKMYPMKVAREALDYYKENVRGNYGISDNLAAKKITRNWLLGLTIPSNDSKYEIRHYGVLVMTRNKNNKAIVKIENKANIIANNGFYIDEKKKTVLNFKLGIIGGN